MIIRHYRKEDEVGWVRCRVLSFLNTAYFDNVLKEKEKYANPSIELVAEEEGKIIGILDVEYEEKERSVCSRGTGLGGMIWHIAVHPDFRGKGIGTLLLEEAEKIAIKKGLNRFEAWTRDDVRVNRWYVNNDFKNIDSYLHVYLDGKNEIGGVIHSKIDNLYPIQTFAHYYGDEKELMKSKFKRVHECFCFEKIF